MPYKIKSCIICNKEFSPTSGKQNYCAKCKQNGDARKEVLRKYYQTKGKFHDYYKEKGVVGYAKRKKVWNKYNRSEKGKVAKKIYYLKNKHKCIERSLEDKKAISSRRMAGYYLKKSGRERICYNCHAIEKVVIHHKDGDCFNNDLNNLVYLCRSCHGVAHELLNDLSLNFHSNGS